MLSNINSSGLSGLDGIVVKVEADVASGLPSFSIVGLPDTAVKEARDRVITAIKNSGFRVPAKKIVINLAPANMKKEGSCFDLALALSILSATEQIKIDDVDKKIFLGELSLDGSLNRIDGCLPMVISAYEKGYREFFVPFENAPEAAVVEGAQVYGVKSISELSSHLSGEKTISQFVIDIEGTFNKNVSGLLDFADVKGQSFAKRALEIAAAGNHNVLLIGPPGSGKTMLAQRIGTILPDLTFEEALEVSKIHSIAGILPKNTPIITQRPFRNPHHTTSAVALSGGGANPKPGELSLAHNGVLFLDEFPEFSRSVLEVMRQPLEDGKVTISRVNATQTYPCNLMLVASMNPCKCGYFGSEKKECTCTPREINHYRGKVSGPLLDRIDIQVNVSEVDYSDLENNEKAEKSAVIKERVNRARSLQLERYKELGIHSNSELTSGLLEEYCRLGERENAVLKMAFEKLGLSARAYARLLKVARTIADLEGAKDINVSHISEATQYRNLDRKYFE